MEDEEEDEDEVVSESWRFRGAVGMGDGAVLLMIRSPFEKCPSSTFEVTGSSNFATAKGCEVFFCAVTTVGGFKLIPCMSARTLGRGTSGIGVFLARISATCVFLPVSNAPEAMPGGAEIAGDLMGGDRDEDEWSTWGDSILSQHLLRSLKRSKFRCFRAALREGVMESAFLQEMDRRSPSCFSVSFSGISSSSSVPSKGSTAGLISPAESAVPGPFCSSGTGAGCPQRENIPNSPADGAGALTRGATWGAGETEAGTASVKDKRDFCILMRDSRVKDSYRL